MIRFILADLKSRPLSVVLMILLVAAASALGAGIILQERALRLGGARAAAPFEIIVGAPGSETQLVLTSVFLQPAALPLMKSEVADRLAQDPRAAFVAPIMTGDYLEDYPIVGTSDALVSHLGGVTEGRSFSGPFEAVVGSLVALSPGASFTPVHGEGHDEDHDEHEHEHEGVSYAVVGRLAKSGTPWDRAILVSKESVLEIHGLHDADEAGVPAVLVKANSIADAYRIRQSYRNDESLAVFPAEVLTRLYGILGDVRTMLDLVAAATQLMAGSAILLALCLETAGRKKQIGALRLFGASPAAIFGVVWAESFVLLAAGAALGLAGGVAGASVASAALEAKSGVPLPIEFETGDISYALTVILFMSVASTIPAFIAYRQSPVEAFNK